MSSPASRQLGSVSRAIDGCRNGDRDASAEVLWHRFGTEMTRIARQRLRKDLQRLYDPEDIVNSAFAQVIIKLYQGELESVRDRNDLWRLLLAVLRRKNTNAENFFNRIKRRGNAVSSDSTFARMGGMEVFPASQEDGPSPEELAGINMEFAGLLEALADRDDQTVALMRVAGYSVEEIAERLECSVRTIARRLAEIRRVWTAQRGRE